MNGLQLSNLESAKGLPKFIGFIGQEKKTLRLPWASY